MREYTFVAKDSRGNTKRDEIFAIDEKQAVELLHKQNLTIIKLDLIRTRSFYDRLFHTIKPDLKILVFRQMSAMLSAGIPILRTLNALSQNDGMPPHFKKALHKIYLDVTSGYSLSQALRLFPEYFSPFMVGSIRIGEASGKLAPTIENCAEYLNREYAYNLKLRQALIYPTVLMTCLSLLMIFCFTYMIPTFMDLFGDVQIEVPWPTKILMACTNFMHDQGLRLFLAALPPLAFAIYAFNRWRQTKAGRWYLENAMLRIPWYGHQIRLRLQSTYFRSLATLMDSAIPMISSLSLLNRSMEYEILRATAQFQMATIKEGGQLSTGLRRSGLFQPIALEMVKLSEETATVPQTLNMLANALDEEMSLGLQMLSKLIEPIILCILGVGVTFILLAVFLPIYSLAQSF